MWKNTKVMRITRQPSPVQIMIDQKQLEYEECFKYLGTIITNDARRICKIKYETAMPKSSVQLQEDSFQEQI
jgi:hypothetical protein